MALHTLESQFAGKVKLIYIDPPYNTGSDSFKYNDAFNTSTWLTFMKNRLKVAKSLLNSNGAIFVQCDDNEQAQLKLLMDEIFGVENHRETIVVKTSTPSGVNAINVRRGERLFKVKEYVLFYSKNKEYRFNPLYVKSTFNENYKFQVTKQSGSYQISDISKGKNSQELEDYALKNHVNIYSLEKNNKKAGDKIKAAIEKSKNTDEVIEFVNSKDQLVLIYNGGVFVPLKDRVICENDKFFFGTLISDLWDDEIFQTNQSEGGVSLPGGKKPEKLIRRIIDIATSKEDLILDFHLGSGTTAAVAHKMGRRYIGIEQLDYGNNDSVARLKNVISGDSTGISKLVNWQGGGSFIYCELAKANQTFVDAITEATTTEELSTIWQDMKARAFISYKVDVRQIDVTKADFAELSLDDQKRFLIATLDQNMLYIPLSEMDDVTFNVSEADKALNKQFFNLGGV